MTNTYSYDQSTRRCGPAAESFVLFRLGVFSSWENAMARVLSLWPGGWSDHCDWRDDVNDWPSEHRLVAESLGKQQKMVTVQDLFNGIYAAGTVVVLLHFAGAFEKHWVVWEETTTTHVRVHWGNGRIASIPAHKFLEQFLASETYFKGLNIRLAGKCAYTLVDRPRLSLWQRIRRSILGWWAKRW